MRDLMNWLGWIPAPMLRRTLPIADRSPASIGPWPNGYRHVETATSSHTGDLLHPPHHRGYSSPMPRTDRADELAALHAQIADLTRRVEQMEKGNG